MTKSEPSPTDEQPGAAAAPSRLKLAMRRARIDDAERSSVVAELRGASIARLEMLQDAIAPLLADVPADVDLFDVGITPGEQPRLFIDMIGFVEMGRDRRTYCLVQNSRHGRTIIAESERLDPIVDAIATYIARRLLEREKALAAEMVPAASPAATGIARQQAEPVMAGRPLRRGAARAFLLLIETLGSAVFFGFLAIAAWFVWTRFAAWYWPAG